MRAYEEAKFAIACSTHWRCGENSSLKVLPRYALKQVADRYPYMTRTRDNRGITYKRYRGDTLDRAVTVNYRDPRRINLWDVARCELLWPILAAIAPWVLTIMRNTALIENINSVVDGVIALMFDTLTKDAWMFTRVIVFILTIVLIVIHACICYAIALLVVLSVLEGLIWMVVSILNLKMSSDTITIYNISRERYFGETKMTRSLVVHEQRATRIIIQEEMSISHQTDMEWKYTHRQKTATEPQDTLEISINTHDMKITRSRTFDSSAMSVYDIERDIATYIDSHKMRSGFALNSEMVRRGLVMGAEEKFI